MFKIVATHILQIRRAFLGYCFDSILDVIGLGSHWKLLESFRKVKTTSFLLQLATHLPYLHLEIAQRKIKPEQLVLQRHKKA